MIGSIVIRSQGGPDSREGETREPIIPSRPSVGGSTHSIRRSVALPHDLRFVVSSGVGCRRGGPFDRRNLELVKARQPLKFIPIFRGVGSLIPGLRRALQATKQSRNGFSQGLQVSILSAGSAGLARGFDGHEPTGRKFVNVRKHGGEIRNV